MIDNKYHPLKYIYGFFAAEGDFPIINSQWERVFIDNFYITYDKSVEFSCIKGENNWVVVLGKIVSLRCDSTIHRDIAGRLFEELNVSLNSLYEELDHCCGRFIVIYSFDNKIFALNDATGMKSIYYAIIPKISIASHVRILAEQYNISFDNEMLNDIKVSHMRNSNMSFLPGFATKYCGICCLTPNTSLSLTDGTIQRYFPRENLSSISSRKSIEYATSILKELCLKWCSSYPLAVSITSGVDSRLTTAAARECVDRIMFFTYVRRSEIVNIVDYEIAKQLLDDFNLKLFILNFDHEIDQNDSQFDDYSLFRQIMDMNVESEHFFSLAYAYHREFPRGFLHLRSNIGEIGRARYYNKPFNDIVHKGPCAETFSKIYEIWTRRKRTSFAVSLFERYIEETSLFENCCNYDRFSLFYWEHLMGRWHASLLRESDVVFDTVSLFNCRVLLGAYLAGPFQEQVSGELMLGSIGRLWESLLHYPINPSSDENSRVKGFADPNLRIEQERDRYFFIVDNCNMDCHFAFYLYKDDIVCDRQWYSGNNIFEVVLSEPAVYKVRYFITRAEEPNKGETTEALKKISGWFQSINIG